MDATLSIITKQYDEKGHVDTIKVNADADIYNKNNDTFVVYKEEEEGIKVTTTIKISDNEVSIKKFGNTNSVMVLSEGNSHVSKYRTPQGLFIIETNTKMLNIDKSKENCIKINVEYDIKIMDLFQGRNVIEIIVEIKE
ncbi:DUF1934 domain-containing protein [[Clostridium] dakarense]|uniref:DUF1934 domain-containing protein n=1 Tax=Faecalimicrobium dakarense TaxID=1301100 RepID=UPI0004B6826F|nr:DUF1934 domain-containing protein [[Clostridium] dakarense]